MRWRGKTVIWGLALVANFGWTIPAFADTLVVGNKIENSVTFIDLATGQEKARVATGKAPHEVAISPDGKQAAVVAYGGTSVDIFDVSSAKRVRTIELAPSAAPHGLAWLKNGRIIATVEKSKGIVIVDPRRGSVRFVSTGADGAHMLAISKDQRRAYVANIMSGTVSIVDLRRRKHVGDIAVGGNPEGIAISPDGKELWVGDNSGGRVRIVDLATNEVVATMASDPVPIRIAFSPDGRTAVTSHIGSGTLNIFDVAERRRTRTVEVSGRPEAVQVTVIFSPDGERIYVAETGRATIAEVVLATGEVLRRIATGKGGDGLAIAP